MISRSLPLLRVSSFVFVGLMMALLTPFLRAQPPLTNHLLPNRLSKRVVGDYVYWSKYNDPTYAAPEIPYHKLTHINHAGVSFDATGTLMVPQGFIEPELNNSAHAAGVKVLLLLGGDFVGLEASGAIQTLVDNVAAFEQQYAYDGADIDWEYPASSGDRAFLVKLMASLRASNLSYVLSIDAAPWGGYGYDLRRLQRSLDYVNIMMYDCAGPSTAHGQLNSTIFWDPHHPALYECQPEGSVEQTADYVLKRVPGEQLNMGTPFYGYHYANIHQLFGLCPNAAFTPDGECDDSVQSRDYGLVLKPLINKHGWKTIYDPVAMVPYMLKVDGSDGHITYDDPFSTYFRVWYSDWQHRLGGTFMWSLDADYDGHSQDLLDAMYAASVGSK